MAKCSRAPGINEGHSLSLNSHGYWICEYGCGYKKKAAKQQGLAEGGSTQIKVRGAWGSKNDKELSKGKSRVNPDGSAGKGGCAGAFIGLAALGGGLLYAAADTIWRFVA